MLQVAAGEYDSWWFGVAWAGDEFVATAIGSTSEDAIRNLRRCLPDSVEPAEGPTSPFLSDAVAMLGQLEQGNEENKHFRLSREYVSAPMYRILTTAAAIPIGYVTTYGNIAAAAGSVGRAVGRAMATNPLYPIVPCHRVVGADMSLVGYGGKQDAGALGAKLNRIRSEARGYQYEKEIPLTDGSLTVYPGEWVIVATHEQEERRLRKSRQAAERAAADRRQLRLF